jgi:hypothetical protein
MGIFRGVFSILYIREDQRKISEAAMSGIGIAQRHALRVNEPQKTGARSARARTHGQKPQVFYKHNI